LRRFKLGGSFEKKAVRINLNTGQNEFVKVLGVAEGKKEGVLWKENAPCEQSRRGRHRPAITG